MILQCIRAFKNVMSIYRQKVKGSKLCYPFTMLKNF